MALADALIRRARARSTEVLRDGVGGAGAYGGTVEKYAGDVVMAAFASPSRTRTMHSERLELPLGIRVGTQRSTNSRSAARGRTPGTHRDRDREVVATPTDARQRPVTGEAVGIAAKLEAAADADTIVVGELAGRPSTAAVWSRSAARNQGQRDPVLAYRLLDLSPVTSAFSSARRASRRAQGELAALRRTLKAC
jgi:class 3 adenylate cyclase